MKMKMKQKAISIKSRSIKQITSNKMEEKNQHKCNHNKRLVCIEDNKMATLVLVNVYVSGQKCVINDYFIYFCTGYAIFCYFFRLFIFCVAFVVVYRYWISGCFISSCFYFLLSIFQNRLLFKTLQVKWVKMFRRAASESLYLSIYL